MSWHANNLTNQLSGQRAIFGLTALVNPNDVHTPGPVHKPSKHVYFQGRTPDGADDGRIHEFSSIGSTAPWHHSDLTSKTGAPTAQGVPSSYMFKGQLPDGRTKHVIYQGFDPGDQGRIHELSSNGDWQHNDLTSLAQNAPRTLNDVFGYEYSFFDTIHQQNIISRRVAYVTVDHDIQLLHWEPSDGWHKTVLAHHTGAFVPPTAYAFTVQGQAIQGQASQRILYLTPDDVNSDVQRLHELTWNEKGPNNSHWQTKDLTLLTNAPRLAGSAPVGLMHDLEFTLHVFYQSAGQHLFELYWNNLGWHVNDLTSLTGAPPAAGSPVAYVHLGQGTLNVNYPGFDGHIHALWRDEGNTWLPANHLDLTVTAGAPPTSGQGLVGFVFRDLTQHIFYIADTSPNSHIGDVIELTDE
jgi:hypothetical protein